MRQRTYFASLAGIVAAVLATPAVHAVPISVSNGIYEVRVEGAPGPSIGSWMAFTGAGHPTGMGNDLLFVESSGSSFQTTNFSSLRVFAPGSAATDYTFGGSGGGINLDIFFASEGASPIPGIADGHRTVWNVTPEGITIIQDVVIVGTTFANSAIYHTVELSNTGSASTSVGWRNLYDWQVDDPTTDDGPSNQVERSDGTVVVADTPIEFAHTPAADELVRVSKFPGASTYQPLLALGFDPGFLPGFPVTFPDEYVFGHWPTAFGTAFDFTPSGLDIATGESSPVGDSAGLSWFGRDALQSIDLGPGESLRLTQIIFAVPPGEQPPRPMPEPSTLALFGLGLAGLAIAKRRRRVGSSRDRVGRD